MTHSVALTFDDGPDPRWTPRLLEALEAGGAKATFFVQGDRLVDWPQVAAEAAARGHSIQPHCFEHRSHSTMSEADIGADLDLVLAVLRDRVGVESPTLWRPPNGDINRPATYDVAGDRGLEVVTWTLQTCDWAGRSAERMWREIVDEERPSAVLRPDSVVLMHDPMGAETVELLERLVAEIRRRGWSIAPLATGVTTPERPFNDCP